MKMEMLLFGIVASFFAGTAFGYGWSSGREPAGTAVLVVSFLMTALISLFLYVQYRKLGTRPEDHKGSEVRQRSGPLDFFPARSGYPLLTAVGFAGSALGVIYGLWLFVIAISLLAAGVSGFAFQYVDRDG